jgi:ankyrin repeat protein
MVEDVNRPDSKGRLPLLEAVRTQDKHFVDSLLQHRAQTNAVDPATASTPAHIAFQQGSDEVCTQSLNH